MTTGIFGNFFCGSEAGDCSLDTGSADGHDQNLQWKYKLKDTKLVVLQGMNNESVDITSIRAMVMEDFYKNSEERLVEQKQKIASLEQSLKHYKTFDELGKKLVPEIKVLYPSVEKISISHALELTIDSTQVDTVTLAVIKFGKKTDTGEREKMTEWLKARTGAKELRMIAE